MKKAKELYISSTLINENIIKIENKTPKICYVYCENYVYIFNFANKSIDYIKAKWGDKTESYLKI